MAINKNFVKDKLNHAKKYLNSLKEIISQPEELFLEDLGLQLKGERIFEVIAQIILDICTHIVANSDVDTPTSYSDCINILVKLKIISKLEANDLISLVKMRNLVVHQYGAIDYHILFSSLKLLEKDFLTYQNSILSWLDQYQ